MFRDLLKPFQRKLKRVPPGKLLVWGAIEGGERAFGIEELRALPAEFQIPDAERYRHGTRGRAVRLAGLLAAVCVEPEAIYANAGDRGGTKVLSLWRRELEPLGLILYELDGRPLELGQGGPFRLVIPGAQGARGAIDDLASLELGTEPEPERS